MITQSVDVLIVGSGPIGATYARMINEKVPDARILMIDLGPRLTEKAGQHVKNIADVKERELAQVTSQGNSKFPYKSVTVAERATAAQKGQLSIEMLARPGTHLVTNNIEDLSKNQMPAASLSSNVGGMGSHWTCACPRPGNAERIPFIPDEDYEKAFSKAEELLCVTQNAFPDTPEGLAILNVLGKVFNTTQSANRKVQRMPLACKTDENGMQYWVGADVILGNMEKANDNFVIRSETICRKLIISDVGFLVSEPNNGNDETKEAASRHSTSEIRNRISGAIIEYLPTRRKVEIKAKIVIVAADAIRTPQLLWASGIRPKALGHYLNEHPFIFCFVELNDDLVKNFGYKISDFGEIPKSKPDSYRDRIPKSRDPTIGVFWVPFDAPHHPCHGQIMHMDASPIQIETHGNPKHIVGLGWGTLKEVRYEDQIVFSETEKDHLGMPKMNFKFTLTEQDKKAINQAFKIQAKAAAAFGKVIKEGEQTLMPPGSSLHYEGTTRMGETNDGDSVCDSYSQVWGYDNLFVGGNGIIPLATTSNPTLTSVAMAVRASGKIISILKQSL
jgi:pyranose oxidase